MSCKGRCSAGTSTCFDNPHPGAPFSTGSFQRMRMKGRLHPEHWGQRSEPRKPAGNILQAGLKPRGPTFLCLTHQADRPSGWGSPGKWLSFERQNPGWRRGLTWKLTAGSLEGHTLVFPGPWRHVGARAPHHSAMGTPGQQEAHEGTGRAAWSQGSNRLGLSAEGRLRVATRAGKSWCWDPRLGWG